MLIGIVAARTIYSGFVAVSETDIAAGVIAALIFLIGARSLGLGRLQNILAPLRQAGRLALCASAGVVGVVCLFFLLKDGPLVSRGVVLLYAALAPGLVVLERFVLASVARAAIENRLSRGSRVVVIGEIGELERLRPSESLAYGIEEVGRFAVSRGVARESLSAADRARIQDAIAFARKTRAAEFAIVMPWSRDRALSELTQLLRASPLAARLYPDHRTRDILLQKRESHFDPYLSVEIQREPLSRLERLAKRALDLAASTAALIVLSPILTAAAVLIKLDSPGPVIFRQRRRGFDSRDFVIWKFRTMRVMEDGAAIRQARRDDDRVTRVGAVLRRTSVDELPQLFNVLRGDMSLVGPRPHALAHDEQYGQLIRPYALRHHVKPGLTGAAQVEGLRGETRTLDEMEKRVQRDLWYINNWSLWLDVKILLLTFFSLARHEAF